jgi:methyltransferase-like protein/2-polyprenyl-3-methyl-5-hydroxy-6-metoxy-1,4-benzoquinol methylase
MSKKTAVKSQQEQAYDELPYESFSHPQTHPSHLSMVGTLFGLTPPDFRTARVLEIGCAAGGNILPLAFLYPKASFTGLDISQAQITQANKHKQALNLKNITFQQQDMLEFSLKDNAGKFDYIIAHGILSWVPEHVREKLFEICNSALSPNGLAVISYNALPGWSFVRGLREMMLFHTRNLTTPLQKIQQAHGLLNFLSDAVPETSTEYRSLIEAERKTLQSMNDTYLYHDHLENINTPFFLHEFVGKAQAHGLEYVGDTAITSMYAENMPPKAVQFLRQIGDIIDQEQYMDFITNRRFRTSILCKKGAKLDRHIKNEHVLDYYLSFNPLVKVSSNDPKQQIVFTVNNGNITTNNEMSGTLLLELVAAGTRPISAEELISNAQKKLKLEDPEPLRKILVDSGIQFFLKGFWGLNADRPEYVIDVSKKPVAFPIAHYQAGLKNCVAVTNAFGSTLPCNAIQMLILKNLDGSKTVEDIAAILAENVKSGMLSISKDGASIQDPAEMKKGLLQVAADTLQTMGRMALLVR